MDQHDGVQRDGVRKHSNVICSSSSASKLIRFAKFVSNYYLATIQAATVQMQLQLDFKIQASQQPCKRSSSSKQNENTEVIQQPTCSIAPTSSSNQSIFTAANHIQQSGSKLKYFLHKAASKQEHLHQPKQIVEKRESSVGVGGLNKATWLRREKGVHSLKVGEGGVEIRWQKGGDGEREGRARCRGFERKRRGVRDGGGQQVAEVCRSKNSKQLGLRAGLFGWVRVEGFGQFGHEVKCGECVWVVFGWGRFWVKEWRGQKIAEEVEDAVSCGAGFRRVQRARRAKLSPGGPVLRV
ncbi:hypothetical protein ACLOJK_024217 [Asimina triloba]